MNIPRKYIELGVTAAVSLLVGGGAGYLITKRKLDAKYAAIAEQEIAEAKKFYAILHKKDDYATPESTVMHISREVEQDNDESIEEATDAMLKYQGGVVEDESEEDPVEVVRRQLESRNIFTNASADAFDYDSEIAQRSPDKPYIISQDEFLEAEPDFDQTTITYYEGDEVLADERDQVIDAVEMTVGEENLQKFGHGSGDKNVVYIRNEKLELDFEVLKSTGKYVEEVLGFIEHSNSHDKLRRFRGDDE